MLNRLLARLIRVYQQYISPYKGFRCAYAVKHQDLSCSEYARVTLLQSGTRQSFSLIQQRFHDCKLAAEALEKERKAKKSQRKHAQEKDNNRCDGIDCNCSDLPDVSQFACKSCHKPEIPSCKSCDMPDLHCGGMDVAHCDACSCSW
ncbi:hypothetical protein BegalDRAFT_2427 [Beggiatoa alba B18LD]|uniref:Membrane protein insertion efficiency factor YidD n=1 Tax=Beggiatoa alba B18LD TaxID=395493 RepID=I3CI35_9GAMM|nr:membrane protein insertion efficiency factor YidD [Beggiatoa alba]EIJ43278.1 hypothetical protein BegalDRAFT_2427 [Beggiatoa alba B18LD]